MRARAGFPASEAQVRQRDGFEFRFALDDPIDPVRRHVLETLSRVAPRPADPDLLDGHGSAETDLLLHARASERAAASRQDVDRTRALGFPHLDRNARAHAEAVGHG